MLWLGRFLATEFEESVAGVLGHGEPDHYVLVIPIQVHAAE
jgi:hypothetical protein